MVGRCPNCGGEVKDGKCLYCDTVCNQFEVSSNKLRDMVKEVRLHEIDEQSKNVKLKLHNEKIKLIILLIVVILIVAIFCVNTLLPRIQKIFSNDVTSHKVEVVTDNRDEIEENIRKNINEYINNYESDSEQSEEQENIDKINLYKEKGRWPAGSYKIGEDIPEGTYLLVSSGETPSTEFPASVYSDAECSSENCISTDTWAQNSRYVTLSGEGYLDFAWCILIDTEKNEVENNPYEHSGMFLVGKDIEPGTYELEECDEYTASYTIYTDVDMIASITRKSEMFEEGCTVTVEDGDYLKLERCKIKE